MEEKLSDLQGSARNEARKLEVGTDCQINDLTEGIYIKTRILQVLICNFPDHNTIFKGFF